MKILTLKGLDKIALEHTYIWYACYGSNLDRKRFMYYIKGDKKENLSEKEGCNNKEKPLDEKPYIFNHPIYFAFKAERWQNGGIAFLDYEKYGFSYGKIYKITVEQFKDIFKQENTNSLYSCIIYLEDIDGLPVITFTAKEKYQNLNKPSEEYKEVISNGIRKTFPEVTEKQIQKYFKKK